MKLFIKKLILWPRNHRLNPREITFSVDKINIITGESGTGKSSIAAIIDYCLGSGKCSIPVGRIREKCEWYGLLLGLEHGEMLIARHDPDEQQTTGDMYINEGSTVQIPYIISEKNINVEVFKDKMNNLAGIPKISVGGTEQEYAKPIYPAFRDMAAFNFQPQHIIANPYTLFFKTDTTQHREKLRTIFPFVLGSITPEMLVLQKELKDLGKEIQALEQNYNVQKAAADNWLTNIEGYYIQAREFGLLPNGSDDRSGWKTERYLSELRSVGQNLDNVKIPDVVLGAGEEYARQLQSIIDRETQLREEKTDLSLRIAKLQGFHSIVDDYRGDLHNHKDRIQSVGWLKEKIKGAYECPICAAHHNEENGSLLRLLSVVQQFSDVTKQVQSEPTRIEVELSELKKDLRNKETELKKLHEMHIVLLDKNKEQSRHMQEVNQIYRFVGKLEQALESFSPTGTLTQLELSLAKKREMLKQLRQRVDKKTLQKRFETALRSVSEIIGEYAQRLQLEHQTGNIDLDPKELTVKFDQRNGRTDYLWEVGSGQNWVGYHIATLLAIHSFLLTLDENAVPSFIVFDQPSQVYFPEASWGTLDAMPSSSYENVSEDIKGVQRIFSALNDFLGKHHGTCQIIVTEHAGSVTWNHINNAINLVGNWRKGQEDYLIPTDWLSN